MDHPDYAKSVHAKNVPYSEKTCAKLNPLKRLAPPPRLAKVDMGYCNSCCHYCCLFLSFIVPLAIYAILVLPLEPNTLLVL